MKVDIDKFGRLVVSVNKEEQKKLKTLKKRLGNDWDADKTAWRVLKPILGEQDFPKEHPLHDSQLWNVMPEEIGALTSAPCIGQHINTSGLVGCHVDPPDSTLDAGWAFMDYQVRNLQDDLLEKGEAIFQRG
jgi:hypothetical protein